jgi:chemotaxis protein MotA
MTRISYLGLIIGFGAVLLGNVFEGGHTASLIQGSAFFIVMGGTLGAVFLSHTRESIWLSLKMLRYVFISPREPVNYKDRMLEYSRILKKEGRSALEKKIHSGLDTWEQDLLKMVVDGISPVDIRDALESKLLQFEKRLNLAAKVFSDAGGYAPTIGILGAVLGLIHVMGNLSDTSKLGSGIAVAFVATIYGVGFANLLFLPISSKIKLIINEIIEEKQSLIEGGVALSGEAHALVIEAKMSANSRGLNHDV